MDRHGAAIMSNQDSARFCRHAHVFLVKQRAPIAEVIDALVLIWSASSASEWQNRILEIPL